VQAGAGHNVKFLGSLQPDVAARTLVQVENDWQEEVAAFVACDSSASACLGASHAFEKSCTEVVSSVVTGSKGDKGVVQEYWRDVCGEVVNDEIHKNQCEMLGSVMDSRMSLLSAQNRMSFNALDTCKEFFSRLENSAKEQAVAEKAIADKAAAEKADEEKVAAEKAAVEKAKAQKAADEKAKADKAAAEKAMAQKVAEEKVAAQKAMAEKAAAEKAKEEKAIVEKAAAEKAKEEKALSEKAAAKKATEEKVASAKSVVRNAANEKVAAKSSSSARTIAVKQAERGVSSKSLQAATEEEKKNTATVQQDVAREGETVVEHETKKKATIDKATVSSQDARVEKMMKEVEATTQTAHDTMKKAELTTKNGAQAKKASKPIAPPMTLSKKNGVVAVDKSKIVSASAPLKEAGAGHVSRSSSTIKK